jgi:hypothetical protein
MGFLPSGIIVVAAGPLTGFLIILFSRFVAEQLRLFAALVNNIKYIAIGIKASKAGPPVSGAIPQAREKKE